MVVQLSWLDKKGKPTVTEEMTEPEKLRKKMYLMASKEENRLVLEERRKAGRHLVYKNNGLKAHRVRNSVCTDDINAWLNVPVYSRKSKDTLRNNINGAIFKCAGWKWLGEIRSQRDNSHGTRRGLWTLEKFFTKAKEDFDREYAK